MPCGRKLLDNMAADIARPSGYQYRFRFSVSYVSHEYLPGVDRSGLDLGLR